jgi:hypothetical protein
MDLRIEIAAEQVTCRQGGAKTFSTSLKEFVAALAQRADPPSLSEMIPEGVRFVHARRDVVVLAIEESPQIRTVRWLADGSPSPFGVGATYRAARLAFPFVVVVIAFRNGGLTGYQQCFYRTAPLKSLTDPLLLPNLYNVAPDAYGQKCWLCLASLQTDLRPLTLQEKVREVRQHFWGAAFNRSSEIHESASGWTAMQSVDRRVQTIDDWERATREDRFFPLGVAWRPAGTTVGQVIDHMIATLCPQVPQTVAHLAQLVSLLSAKAAARQTTSA